LSFGRSRPIACFLRGGLLREGEEAGEDFDSIE
jgi:hypothetical protein